MTTMPKNIPDDILVMNCADCGRVCAADSAAEMHPGLFESTGLVRFGGRIKSRPYCRGCLKMRGPRGRGR